MARVVLDSSVVIALTNPADLHHEAAVVATSASNQYLLSVISVSEALVTPHRISRSAFLKVEKFIHSAFSEIIPITASISGEIASIRAVTNLKLPDAIISATATREKAVLWTFDKKLALAHPKSKLLR